MDRTQTVKDKIFCYSGTGNSLASAKQMASELNMEVTHLTDELVGGTYEGDVCIIIYPTYAYCIPKTVVRFIQKSAFNFSYIALITTYGSRHGGALAEGIKRFRKKKIKVNYTNGAKSVENYVHLFGFPKEKPRAKRQALQQTQTQRLIEDLKSRKTNRRFLFRPFSSFVAVLFRAVTKHLASRYKVTDDCTACGTCAAVCPANCITLKNILLSEDTETEINTSAETLKPVFDTKKCDHCQACLQLCPHKAIRFGRIRPNTSRYLHKDITPDDMIKR